MAKVEQEFQQPGNLYRGKPFWAWNGLLKEDELRRQIRVMHKMGLGGFFMHSRIGLKTPYLGEEWFRLTKACIDEAHKLDMEAWLYDEDRWPSGAAGGLVTKDPRYRQKRLRLEVTDKIQRDADVIAVFEANVDGQNAAEVKRLRKGTRPSKGKRILLFRQVLADNSDWYNGYTYLDTMSHEAVQKFVEVTHEHYRREVGEDFGGRIPGMFTDEPNHGATLMSWDVDQATTFESDLPWTDNLPRIFKQRYGYDLVNHLPEIFFDVDGKKCTKARLDYHDCKTFLFTDAFGRQIGEWCDENKLIHTGHVLEEPNLATQTNMVGQAMRFYEHMQAPGIDVLCDQDWELDTAKQCASVVNQMGRQWMLSETYGTTGWDFSFQGHKAVGDWQAALGVNLRCHHLSWYTMAGEAKRDYPASILHHSPWWDQYNTVEEYFSRIHVLTSRGRAVRELLFIHPIESQWARCRVGWYHADDTRANIEQMTKLRDWLLDANIDFDYGDEEMMSRLSSVSKAGGEPRLKLGKASYKVVLVPPLLTIRSSTLALLKRFADAGGVVVFAGDLPSHVDGEPAEAVDLSDQALRVACTRGKVLEAVEPARMLSLTDADGKEYQHSLYQLRQDGDDFYLFLQTRDRKNPSGPLTLTTRVGRSAEEWEPMTGERFQARHRARKEDLVIETDFTPCGHRLFVLKKQKTRLKPRPSVKVEKKRTINPARWSISLDEPNVLVMDRPQFRIGGGQWRKAQEILKADRAIREEAGFFIRGGQMKQPWAREPSDKPRIPLELRYTFDVKLLPAGPLALALEDPEKYLVSVNGQNINTDCRSGWWVDTCIEKVPLDPALFRAGENEIVLATAYGEDDDLEASFLLGDFGVQVKGTDTTLIGPPRELKPGNWVKQGLPFYSGAVTYRYEMKNPKSGKSRVYVEVPEFAGACVRFFVDGRPVATTGWPPFEADITDYLTGSKHEIAIQVVSHRRNSFGPLHHTDPLPAFLGPLAFVTTGDQWMEDYNLAANGLLKAPVLTWRRVR